jgi:DNA primase small subunit
VDRFVKAELGFEEKDLLLTFSGGRGYHCHVLQEKALALTSVERREVVDYVTGTGLQLEKFIRSKKLHRQIGGFSREVDSMEIDTRDSPGWGSRINEAVVHLIRDWKASDEEKLKEDLGAVYKFTKPTWITFQRDLARADPKRIEEGYLDFGSVMLKILPRKLKLDAILPLAKGETDEPVTSDVKRLIRLPGSLHGKSGLRVVTLQRNEIDKFDPLVDAVAFTDEPTEINVVKPAKVDVAGVNLDLPIGKATVPEAAAVMLMARGAAVPL